MTDETLKGAPENAGANASNINNGDITAAEAALRARLSRKRTKTGCLTCRKRRIKCDEGRPLCKNCVKSRRHCEGYSQRVVFKPPPFEYQAQPHNGSTPVAFHQLAYGSPDKIHHTVSAAPYAFDQFPFSPIYPRPVAYPVTLYAQDQDQQYYHQPVHPVVPLAFLQHEASSQLSQQQHAQSLMSQQAVLQPVPLSAPYTPALQSGILQADYLPAQHYPPHPAWSDTITQSTSPSNASLPPVAPMDTAVFPNQQHVHNAAYLQDLMISHDGQFQQTLPLRTRSPQLQPQPPPPSHSESTTLDFIYADSLQQHILPDCGPTQLLTDAAVEVQDDDYYDVDNDEELDLTAVRQTGGLVSVMQQLDAVQQMQLRSYDIFLSHGMLDTYRPEIVANPLRNPATARVFLHFVSATGPSLNPFERRHASTPSMRFGDRQIPLTQRGIWTYTMPMAALHNQGLLHAMLALASLHIAHLQGGSTTPSMQHYIWSLKRIHNAVANPKKRLNLATIAASMLLGFYEIMTAEHSKWSTHLAGAMQLVLETDFAGMMRQFRAMKSERRIRLQHEAARISMPPSPPDPEGNTLDQIPEIDENVVSRFFGQEIKYGRQGYIEDSWTGPIPRLDLGKLEILKDLFWWYCKQDAYQSIVSGNPLLMDYSRWSACPPRAPLGRSDAVYGSFDHLILLLGRVASFAAKDRSRKLKVMEQNGGQWKPHPASKMARAPPPKSTAAQAPSPSGPAFYGMAPASSTKVRMPASYDRLGGDSPPGLAQETWSLETALAEYNNIQAALAEFKAGLGPAFEPLSDECHSPVFTAFGPALVYASYDIGCLLANWNMTVLIAIRSHPYLHPAAHAAAAMAAGDTAPYASKIGRIAAGIVPDSTDVSLNPFLGAALIESCMPSFFAAIQYQQADQRYETVTRLFNIARRTGWGTADLIANGCETAWVKAALAGRGQPYTRIARSAVVNSHDARLNGSWERHDPSVQPDEEDDVDRRYIKNKAVARLHWAIGIIGVEDDI